MLGSIRNGSPQGSWMALPFEALEKAKDHFRTNGFPNINSHVRNLVLKERSQESESQGCEPTLSLSANPLSGRVRTHSVVRGEAKQCWDRFEMALHREADGQYPLGRLNKQRIASESTVFLI